MIFQRPNQHFVSPIHSRFKHISCNTPAIPLGLNLDGASGLSCFTRLKIHFGSERIIFPPNFSLCIFSHALPSSNRSMFNAWLTYSTAYDQKHAGSPACSRHVDAVSMINKLFRSAMLLVTLLPGSEKSNGDAKFTHGCFEGWRIVGVCTNDLSISYETPDYPHDRFSGLICTGEPSTIPVNLSRITSNSLCSLQPTSQCFPKSTKVKRD